MSIDKAIKVKNYPIYLGPQVRFMFHSKIGFYWKKEGTNQIKLGCTLKKKKLMLRTLSEFWNGYVAKIFKKRVSF